MLNTTTMNTGQAIYDAIAATQKHLGNNGANLCQLLEALGEDRDEAHDQQLTKVMTRVVGTGIGNVVKGGEEDLHGRRGLLRDGSRPRIHPPTNLKTTQTTSNPKRDSPAVDRGDL